MTIHEIFKTALDAAGVKYNEQGDEDSGYIIQTEENSLGCAAFIAFDEEGNLIGIEGDIVNELNAMVALTKRMVFDAHGITLDQYEAERYGHSIGGCEGQCENCSCPEDDEPEDDGRGTIQ